MVTGRVPFEGPDVSSILLKHLDEPVVPPDHINPQLTRGTSEIVELCMVKKARKRYASTKDLIEDLQAVADGRPPLQARKLIDLSAFDSIDQESITDLPKEEHDETSLITTPLFWIAIVGWFLATLLLIIVILLVSRILHRSWY
jgi:serine/threonine protein kinase